METIVRLSRRRVLQGHILAIRTMLTRHIEGCSVLPGTALTQSFQSMQLLTANHPHWLRSIRQAVWIVIDLKCQPLNHYTAVNDGMSKGLDHETR